MAVIRVWGPGRRRGRQPRLSPSPRPPSPRNPTQPAPRRPRRLRHRRRGGGRAPGRRPGRIPVPRRPCCRGSGPGSPEVGGRPTRFLFRLAGEPGRSRIQVEALEDLARTETSLAAEILLEQSEGALEFELARITQLLGNPTNALSALDLLLARARVGRKLLTGWTVALAGRPNVGKSRLLNALAGFDRAIVDPTPGTTRDVVTVRTALGGWPVELADTAGLRDSDDPIETAGVALARSAQAGADLVILVLDGSEPLTEADHSLISALPNALLVANKSDLPPFWSVESLGARAISAERGDGLEALVREPGRSPRPGPFAPRRGGSFSGDPHPRHRACSPADHRGPNRSRHEIAGSADEQISSALTSHPSTISPSENGSNNLSFRASSAGSIVARSIRRR